ncbi:MAG: hypothetical protein QXV75_08095 [Candidatus Bathyarchaeia archaeon]
MTYLGKGIVGKRGQSSLGVTIPKAVIVNYSIDCGDVIEFFKPDEKLLSKLSYEEYFIATIKKRRDDDSFSEVKR